MSLLRSIRSTSLLPQVLAAFSAFALVGCAEDETTSPTQMQTSTLVDVATKAGNFKTLVSALVQTGLDKTLAGPGPFTVFAPTDEAFARLPAGVVASLDKATLSTILTYHVHPGKAPASVVTGLSNAPTVQGESIGVTLDSGSVYLDGIAKVVTTDIAADNGIIHVIDAVLLPPSVAFPGTLVDQLKSSPRFSSLVDAVVKADLAGALSGTNEGKGYTVFAPTNAAFAPLASTIVGLDKAALSKILLYHVAGTKVPAATVVTLSAAPTLEGGEVAISVANGSVTLDGEAKVLRTDWNASNGIVHIIDSVLTP